MKILFYIIILAAFLLVTFFGLGPVMLADGSRGERLVTLLVVVLIYLLLLWITVRFRKRNKNNKK
jgi:TM2 domain-containing membrane protein YozV